MATEHLCVDGKWRKGKVKDCPKDHEKRQLKRPSVKGANSKEGRQI